MIKHRCYLRPRAQNIRLYQCTFPLWFRPGTRGRPLDARTLNYHCQDTTEKYARNFSDHIDNYILIQHIMVPTHRGGNILDLEITRIDELILSKIQANQDSLLDHSAVIFDIDVSKPNQKSASTSRHSWMPLDTDSFNTWYSKLWYIVYYLVW